MELNKKYCSCGDANIYKHTFDNRPPRWSVRTFNVIVHDHVEFNQLAPQYREAIARVRHNETAKP